MIINTIFSLFNTQEMAIIINSYSISIFLLLFAFFIYICVGTLKMALIVEFSSYLYLSFIIFFLCLYLYWHSEDGANCWIFILFLSFSYYLLSLYLFLAHHTNEVWDIIWTHFYNFNFFSTIICFKSLM